jgi:quinol monooxygenase YgiN
MTMTYYGLHGGLQAQPGQGPALAAILLEAARLMSGAPGCRLYLVSRDTAVPETIYITEVWESEADHDNSLALPGVRDLISRAMPLLAAGPEQGQQLTVLGGHGLE